MGEDNDHCCKVSLLQDRWNLDIDIVEAYDGSNLRDVTDVFNFRVFTAHLENEGCYLQQDALQTYHHVITETSPAKNDWLMAMTDLQRLEVDLEPFVDLEYAYELHKPDTDTDDLDEDAVLRTANSVTHPTTRKHLQECCGTSTSNFSSPKSFEEKLISAEKILHRTQSVIQKDLDYFCRNDRLNLTGGRISVSVRASCECGWRGNYLELLRAGPHDCNGLDDHNSDRHGTDSGETQ